MQKLSYDLPLQINCRELERLARTFHPRTTYHDLLPTEQRLIFPVLGALAQEETEGIPPGLGIISLHPSIFAEISRLTLHSASGSFPSGPKLLLEILCDCCPDE